MLIAGIAEELQSFFFSILLALDSFVYSLINWVYQIILVLCNSSDILGNNFEINRLVQRVYIIIGVIILFLVAYSLLKSMVNPDEALKGKKSPITIVKDVIISVVLIAFVPTIFEFAFGFQGAILKQNSIGNLILGTTTSTDSTGETSENIIEQGGMEVSMGVLHAFLHPKYSECTESPDMPDGYDCSKITVGDTNKGFDEFWNDTKASGNLLEITKLSRNAASDGNVTYYWIISTIAGIYVLYVFISFCFDIALRTIKLAVYQLIAPLPILARIIPNENASKSFSNWVKATISTFLEVFIRLAILFFIILLTKIVTQNFTNIFRPFFTGSNGFTVALFAQAFIIIGIMMFAKEAPNIIKEITGLDGGKYGKSFIRATGMMAGSLGGGATAAIRSFANDKDKPLLNRFGRALSAGVGANARGLYQGSKAQKFGDAPKAAGKAASNTLAHRANVAAAGGQLKYRVQQAQDTWATVKDWAGGTTEALKHEKQISDKLLGVVKDVKAIAEDYVDKHAYEYTYFDELTSSEKDKKDLLEEKLRQAKNSGDRTSIETAQTELDQFNNQLKGKYRLDILKAKSEDVNLTAEERAEYVNLYNKARKKTVDDFATTVHTHEGAEKEAYQVKEAMKTMTQLTKEEGASMAVQFLTKGSEKYGLKANEQELTEATAASYFKDAKKAAEFANIENQAKLAEAERQEERRKARSGNSDKK